MDSSRFVCANSSAVFSAPALSFSFPVSSASAFLSHFARIPSVNFSKPSLRSSFNACTGRKIFPFNSISSCSKLKDVAPVLFNCLRTFSSVAGWFCALWQTWPSTFTITSPLVSSRTDGLPSSKTAFPETSSFFSLCT